MVNDQPRGVGCLVIVELVIAWARGGEWRVFVRSVLPHIQVIEDGYLIWREISLPSAAVVRCAI